MPSKTRLKNTSIWALEDIIAECRRARRAWRKAHARATRQLDAAQLAALGILSDSLADIASIALEARQGKYHDRPPG